MERTFVSFRAFPNHSNIPKWLLEHAESSGAIVKGGKINVLTVCNTGSLATSAYGTALGLITTLHRMGRLEHAFFAQTVPYQQGARLTALELQTLEIPSTMVPDTAIAALIQGKAGYKIHGFIAGADRLARILMTGSIFKVLQNRFKWRHSQQDQHLSDFNSLQSYPSRAYACRDCMRSFDDVRLDVSCFSSSSLFIIPAEWTTAPQ
jgi:hypothetical protein